MSFFRYFQEKQDADGERLWWPGGPEGFPFRGKQPPQTTREEFDNLRLTGKARVRTFYLDNEEDKKDYIEIRDKCSNGLYVSLDRERTWDPDRKTYRIFLEWLELGYDLPPQGVMTDAVKDYTKKADVLLPYNRLAGLRNAEGW